MKKRDVISSLFWMGFGLIFVIGGIQHGLMEAEGVPGRGALPFITGTLTLVLSLLVLFSVFLKKYRIQPEQKEKFFPERNSSYRLLNAIVLLVLYGFFLKTLGYPLTTFLFLTGALKLIEPQRWKTTVVFSLLTTAISYTIFKVLHVNLPVGILGF
jgi:hypothetical protein